MGSYYKSGISQNCSSLYLVYMVLKLNNSFTLKFVFDLLLLFVWKSNAKEGEVVSSSRKARYFNFPSLPFQPSNWERLIVRRTK